MEESQGNEAGRTLSLEMDLEKWVGSDRAGFCLLVLGFLDSSLHPSVNSRTQRPATVCGEMAAGGLGLAPCHPVSAEQPAVAPSILWKPSLASTGAGWT